MGAIFSSICLFAPTWVKNISTFFSREMGRKTKMERVLEKENFELGKTRVGNWGLNGFWKVAEEQGSRKCEFHKWGQIL